MLRRKQGAGSSAGGEEAGARAGRGCPDARSALCSGSEARAPAPRSAPAKRPAAKAAVFALPLLFCKLHSGLAHAHTQETYNSLKKKRKRKAVWVKPCGGRVQML